MPDGFVLEQALDVFEPGNPRDPFAGEKFPEQNHETAVGNRDIRGEQCATVIFVPAQIDHGRRGWRNEQPAGPRDLVDRFARRPAEELEAKDVVGLQVIKIERMKR